MQVDGSGNVAIYVAVATLEAMDYNEDLKLDEEGYEPVILSHASDVWVVGPVAAYL